MYIVTEEKRQDESSITHPTGESKTRFFTHSRPYFSNYSSFLSRIIFISISNFFIEQQSQSYRYDISIEVS